MMVIAQPLCLQAVTHAHAWASISLLCFDRDRLDIFDVVHCRGDATLMYAVHSAIHIRSNQGNGTKVQFQHVIKS